MANESEVLSNAAFRSAVEKARQMNVLMQREVRLMIVSLTFGAQLAALKQQSGGSVRSDAVYLNGIVINNEKTLDMMIPGSKVGFIIGKGGEMIRNLQERASVKMTVIQQTAEVTEGQKQLRIVGEPSKVDYAKELVNDLLTEKELEFMRLKGKAKDGFTNDYGSSRPGTVEVPVPPQYIGLVIGKGGESIKRIQQETGTKVQFDTTKTDAKGNKICTIQGQSDAVDRAADMVREIIDNAAHGRKNKDGDEVKMTVPANRTGAVIGKGGETIRAIKQQCGCDIELEKNSKGVFIIRGPPDRISYAQQLINEKVHGTSSSPTDDSSSSFSEQQNYWSQYWQSEGSQASNDESANQDTNTAAWAAYYAQYYAQASGTSAPSNGDSAPEASSQSQDYTQQWVEYYRAYGMHKEAEMIEQMSKAGGTQNAPYDSGDKSGDVSNTAPVLYPGYNYPPYGNNSSTENA
ncbi:far upstream element-binding protein 1-like isoform X1 [Leptotrombidium deliense]|uniref:Far upstream element-binding protein 1-like isoform X1 n=1 Tax=Leptotrombidium deliense TaxID=299467 RepID=A0A443SR34_9ACAR|nr:far upstream element-binding protein 1-like isoform X1 [Leptotrombidium deliense]